LAVSSPLLMRAEAFLTSSWKLMRRCTGIYSELRKKTWSSRP
jgi:hypothetical protein